MKKQAGLIAYLFEGQPHPLAASLAQWVEASPRFTAFVETYRDKIRKKIRLARQPESALDLSSELEVAACLLNDRRLAVVYEPYASARRRGPDFAVAYRANLVFNLEVARIRAPAAGAAGASLSSHAEERILRILLDKLGQMQPGMANLLVIHTHPEVGLAVSLDRLMQAVKTRAERQDASFYALSRYSGPAAFYKDFAHLSAILLWTAPAQLWANKQARPALAEPVLRLVRTLPCGPTGSSGVGQGDQDLDGADRLVPDERKDP